MTDQEKHEHFEKARSWAIESDMQEKRSRRAAWYVATGAAGIAVLQAVAIAVLLPLKTTETVMLLVDRTTGYVQEIDPTSAGRLRADDALLQSLLAQYVAAREGYDRASLQSDYRKAALWSAGQARSSYIGSMARNSADSPINRYRSTETLEVQVKSVSQIDRGAALVRFDTILQTSNGQRTLDGSWIAAVNYQFSDAPMSYEDRLINPLGLQVTSYRRDAERPSNATATVLAADETVVAGTAP